MVEEIIDNEKLYSIWKKDGIWNLSDLMTNFRSRILKIYPRSDSPENAQHPSDRESIGKNIEYLFPSHVMKIQKALCTMICDKESFDYFSQTGNITILDLACGAGTASFAFVDFIIGLIKQGFVQRKYTLSIKIVFQDIEMNCVQSAENHAKILNDSLRQQSNVFQISAEDSLPCSLIETLKLINNSRIRFFDLILFSNAFDQVLIHGEKALEIIPACSDPIAHARPCDRPAILGDFWNSLGRYANPYFSRVLLLQENRYSPLMPISLPSQGLKVIRTSMIQKTIRPDYSGETMIVPFAFCGYKYCYSNKGITNYPTPHSIAYLDNLTNCFYENDSY